MPGEFHGQRRLVGYSPWGCKELDTTEWLTLHASSIFSFLRTLCTVFHSGCTNLHSHQQCRRVFFSPHPHQHLSFMFFNNSHSDTCGQYLTVVLICMSLMINDVEHLFMTISSLGWSFYWDPLIIPNFCLSMLLFSRPVVSNSLWPHGLQHTRPQYVISFLISLLSYFSAYLLNFSNLKLKKKIWLTYFTVIFVKDKF